MRHTLPDIPCCGHTLAFLGIFFCLFSLAIAEGPQISAPEILCPGQGHRGISKWPAAVGEPLTISCTVNPGMLVEETLVYWLVNGSFIETVYPNSNDRVRMDQETRVYRNGEVLLQRNLVFDTVLSKDFRSTFTLITNNPVGIAKRGIKLQLKRRLKLCS